MYVSYSPYLEQTFSTPNPRTCHVAMIVTFLTWLRRMKSDKGEKRLLQFGIGTFMNAFYEIIQQ